VSHYASLARGAPESAPALHLAGRAPLGTPAPILSLPKPFDAHVSALMLTRFVRIQLTIFTIVSIIGILAMVFVYLQVPTLVGVGRSRSP